MSAQLTVIEAVVEKVEPVDPIVTAGNTWRDDSIWYLDRDLGPIGRIARVVVDPATDPDEDSYYSRTRTITLFRPKGVEAATIPGLSSYDVEKLVRQWVLVGK